MHSCPASAWWLHAQDASKLPANLFAKVLPVLTELDIRFLGKQSYQNAKLSTLPKCLRALAAASQLMVLRLFAELDELPALPSQLEELIFRSESAKQISSISALTSLKKLNLLGCEALRSLTTIQGCTTLESLLVSGCFSLEAWPDLGALTGLRDLYVEDSPGLDWSFLPALTALTRLAFSYVHVEMLAGLTQLQDLTLIGIQEDEEDGLIGWQARFISAITQLVGLSNLDVKGTPLDSLQWCSALPNLGCLHAGGNYFKSLESLPRCPKLSELHFYTSYYLASLNGLQGCPELATLSLYDCCKLSSLEPLQSCLKLATLSLYDCCKLSSLEPLQSCPELAELSLYNCCQLSSLEPLQGCPKLRELDLIAPKANLPGLEHLLGLEHLRGLPGLKITGL
jgi:Leucine-rich repeat (LRR) protein